MNKLKDLLSNHEGEFNPNAWNELEKRLPKQQAPIAKYVIGGLIGIVATITIGAVINLNEPKSNIQEQISSEQNIITKNQQTVKKINSSVVEKTATKEICETTTKTIVQTSKKNAVAQQEKQGKKIGIVTQNAFEPNFDIKIDNHCIPADVSFIAVNPGEYTIVWDFGNNAKATGNEVMYTYKHHGTYTPTASLYKGNKLVKIFKLKDISFSDAPTTDFTWQHDDNRYMFASEQDSEMQYTWIIDNQKFGNEDVEYEFHKNGTYPVRLITEDKNGCVSTTTKNIDINIKHVFYLPTSFTPDSGDSNSLFGPSGESMVFDSFKFTIKNQEGKVVYSSTNPANWWNGRINNRGEAAEAGMYIWTIKTVDIYGNSQIRNGSVNLIR